jgi:hypothetical protein
MIHACIRPPSGVKVSKNMTDFSHSLTNQMIKGDQATAAHQYAIAILNYGNAWNQVIHFTYQMPLGRH